jgi:predicted HAD superfamily phosphohydrolase YqeG
MQSVVEPTKKANAAAVQTIAVDLDGCLAEYHGAFWRNEIGAPLPEAKELLQCLKDMGYRILLFTSRRGPEVKEWVERWGFSSLIDEINQTKPLYRAFLDDRVVRFDGKDDIEDIVWKLLAPAWWEEYDHPGDCLG